MQIPGIDYAEKYSPVVTKTTSRLIIEITLYNHKKNWKCNIIDIEAAFLEDPIEEPTFMKWPPGFTKLGYITEDKSITTYIRFLKLIYGNVDVALRFYRTYADHLVNEMNMTRSQLDACISFK